MKVYFVLCWDNATKDGQGRIAGEPTLIGRFIHVQDLLRFLDKAKQDGSKVSIYEAECVLDWS